MYLTNVGIDKTDKWRYHGVKLPDFNRLEVSEFTKKSPVWLHFGPGNIFRAFPAVCQQKLLDEGLSNTGIIVSTSNESFTSIFEPHDNLSLIATLKSDGSIGKTILASIIEAVAYDTKAGLERLEEIFCNPTLQMVSLTITEKAYLKYIKNDSSTSKDEFMNPKTIIGILGYLCYKRYKAGSLPLALVSMDNFSNNGDVLHKVLLEQAYYGLTLDHTGNGFIDFLNDKSKVTFPCTMLDKITPQPDPELIMRFENEGFKNLTLKQTSRKTFNSVFINTEEAEYLVIEDDFPAGRPPLEKAGVIFTNRDIVNKVERMKVLTCLNPLHTALAVFGCLLGYKKISDEMKDSDLVLLIKGIGYKEGLPVVCDPQIINPVAFIDEVINTRFPNPFIPDTPARIATDTSQKLPIRFGETLKSYLNREDLDIKSLKFIPLVFAGWIRYLMGVNDHGDAFEVSPDPLYIDLYDYIKNIRLGSRGPFTNELVSILSMDKIFGVNLYEVGLGNKVESYFEELVYGIGSVRSTLHRVVNS